MPELSNPDFSFDPSVLKEDLTFLEKQGLSSAFIRRRVVFCMDGYRYAHAAAQKRWGIPFAFYETGHAEVKKIYLTSGLNQDAATLWLQEMERDPAFAKKITDELRQIIANEKRLAVEIPKIPLTPEGVTEALRQHLKWWIEFFELAHLWFGVDVIKERTDELIRAEWKGSKEDLEHFLENVYRPIQFPTSSIEERELLKIAELPESLRETELSKHEAKYRHLSLRDIDDPYFDAEYYRGRLNVLLEPHSFAKQKELFEMADAELVQADNLVKNAALSDSTKNRIMLVRSFMYLRTESIDGMALVTNAYRPHFECMATLFGIPIQAVLNMTYKEIFDSLEKKSLAVDKEIILDRLNNGYAYLVAPGHSVLVTGKDIDALERACFPDKKEVVYSELKGQIAFKGKVRAQARVILDRRNIGELQKGEILVTTMTTPDFVPAMKISAGIITNEGGILCHAAIMSRELRKPCVIGTKVATDAIKTGQMITLDADTGLVSFG